MVARIFVEHRGVRQESARGCRMHSSIRMFEPPETFMNVSDAKVSARTPENMLNVNDVKSVGRRWASAPLVATLPRNFLLFFLSFVWMRVWREVQGDRTAPRHPATVSFVQPAALSVSFRTPQNPASGKSELNVRAFGNIEMFAGGEECQRTGSWKVRTVLCQVCTRSLRMW